MRDQAEVLTYRGKQKNYGLSVHSTASHRSDSASHLGIVGEHGVKQLLLIEEIIDYENK